MNFELNTKIQPLIEDVGLIVPGTFLKKTEYKRWLVEHKLDGVWSQILKQVKSNRNIIALGFDHEAADSKDSFDYLLNIIYEQNKDKLPSFLFDILSFYAYQETVNIDVTNLKKDLLAAGYSEKEVLVLNDITITPKNDEKIEEDQTEEQKVRNLEKIYLAQHEDNSREAIDAYMEWHSAALLYLSNYYTEANPDFSEFKHIDNSGNGYALRQNYKSLYSIYNLLMNGVTKQSIAKTTKSSKKTPLVFISHSSKDKSFIDALVNLLDDMGFTKETLFCSSVREYGIPLSGDIFETIRRLFLEHDLYVIFVHSPRFYSSAVSLNEMGAAWVLKSDFCSFLTNDMKYDKMKGVVNNAKISIKVDEDDAKGLLNDLYKRLVAIFSLHEMDMNKWERKRDQFLQVVRNLKYENVENLVEENSVDMEYKKLQIAKMKAEAEDRKKAVIRGNIVKGYNGSTSNLMIFNAGKVTARNVRVKWLNESDEVIITSDFSEIGELTPQNSRSYALHLTTGHPKTMNLSYSWDDDYANNNQVLESLQL
jgi:hypothetical protein